MTTKQQAHVSEGKKRIVKDLANLIKDKKTILIASIKSIPGSQFQNISKKLRGKAIVKVPKKNLIFRALDNSSNEIVKKLKDKIEGSVAILFSDIDAFELAAELMKNKSSVKAKPGQEAPEDIEIQAGPTDLVPGPAISELGALGIQIQIDKGKITIKESKVIAKQGEKISENAADLMNKLDMKPFSVGFTPLAAFDSVSNQLYTEINIDKEKTIEELKTSFGKALSFAVEIGYVCGDTIGFLIGKARMHEKVLEKFAGEKSAEADASENKEIINQDMQISNDEPSSQINENNSEPSGEENVDEPSEPEASEDKEIINEVQEEEINEKKTSNDESLVNSSTQSHEPVSAQIKSEPETSEENTQTENVQPEKENQEENK